MAPPLRAVYLDLDGTLLGAGASLLRDGEGAFELLGARALEAIHRAGAELVLFSGRRRSVLLEDARVLGATGFAFEAGAGLEVDGEVEWLTGEWAPRDGASVRAQVAASGAVELVVGAFGLALDPGAEQREVTHVLRGDIDAAEVDAALAEAGFGSLRLLDNGPAKHLLPRGISKGASVARHMRRRGYGPEEVVAVGDSREDLGAAEHVGAFWLVANGVARDAGLAAMAGRTPNARMAEAGHGAGVYEAVVTELAERRA